jgi:hypothetical protein
MNTAELYRAWTTAPTPKMVRKGTYDPGRAIYMSELGGCERKVTLRLLRYEAAPFSLGSQQAMNNGLVWEDYIGLLWEAYAKDAGIPAIRQQPATSPYGNGKLDVWLPTMNHLVEVKAKEAKSRNFLPQRDHLDQVLMYLAYYESYSPNSERPTAELAYCLWDTKEVVSFPVTFDVARMEVLHQWGRRVQQAVWGKKTLPIPDRNAPDQYPCDWGHGQCQYYRHCWSEDAD